jgi:hypothetical protein
MVQSLAGRAAAPAAFGGTGFQPVRRTGKMPVLSSRVDTAHLYHAQARRLCHQILNNFSRQSLMSPWLTHKL